jgi:hypothetical protein
MHFVKFPVDRNADCMRSLSIDEAIVLFVEVNRFKAAWQQDRTIEHGAKVGERECGVGLRWNLNGLVREIVKVQCGFIAGRQGALKRSARLVALFIRVGRLGEDGLLYQSRKPREDRLKVADYVLEVEMRSRNAR